MMQKRTDLARRDSINDDKTQWHLMPWDALEPGVRVFMYGSKKYAPFNWQKGLGYQFLIDSLLRHTFALAQKEDIDPVEKKGSGLHHIGHMICNVAMLSWMIQNRPDMDDRGKEPIIPVSGKEEDNLLKCNNKNAALAEAHEWKIPSSENKLIQDQSNYIEALEKYVLSLAQVGHHTPLAIQRMDSLREEFNLDSKENY